MEINNEKLMPSYSGDIVLGEVMEEICKYLDIKDLCSVAQVCTIWNEAVKRELQYRIPHRIVVYENRNIHVQESFVKVKPDMVILFIQEDLDAVEPREHTISREYFKHFPHILVALEAKYVYTEKNIIDTDKYDEKKSFKILNRNEVPGIIFPKHHSLDIKIICLEKDLLKLFNTERIVNEIMPNNKQFKTILIIFTCNCNEDFTQELMITVKSCFQEYTYALWGGELFFYPCINNCQNTDINTSPIGFLGMSISSSHIDSYSLVIDCGDIDTNSVYEKISEFRNNIKLKKNSFGFINGIAYEDYSENSSDEDMKWFENDDEFYKENYEKAFLFYVKKTFPNVPFISIFNDNLFKVFGNDTFVDDHQELIHVGFFSFLIITYN